LVVDVARFGRILLIVGLVVTLLSFITGFYFMFSGNGPVARLMLMIVPFGFLTLFMGFATVIMFAPRDSNEE